MNRAALLAVLAAALAAAQTPAPTTEAEKWRQLAAEVETLKQQNAEAARKIAAAVLAPTPPPSSGIVEIQNVAPAAFIVSSVAQYATDWDFTGPLSGRRYHISAQKAVAITGGVIGAALTLRKLLPRTARWIDTALLVASGYCAGRAYINATRDVPPTATPAPAQ